MVALATLASLDPSTTTTQASHPRICRQSTSWAHKCTWEYIHGELSTKVDAFAFGLVVVETLTGYAVCSPAPGHRDLLSMFQDELDTADNLVAHLDKRACWNQHKQERIASLFTIAYRCLGASRKKRPELVELIPELEEVRRGTETLQALEAERAVRILVEAEAAEKE